MCRHISIVLGCLKSESRAGQGEEKVVSKVSTPHLPVIGTRKCKPMISNIADIKNLEGLLK